MYLSFYIDCDFFERGEIIVPPCACQGVKHIPETELMNEGMSASSNYAYFIFAFHPRESPYLSKTYNCTCIPHDLWSKKKLIGKIKYFTIMNILPMLRNFYCILKFQSWIIYIVWSGFPEDYTSITLRRMILSLRCVTTLH